MTNKQELLDASANFSLGTYNKDLILTRGEGSYLYDIDGNRFLDFTTGIAVCSLGHAHPAVTDAICTQAAKLTHVSNLFYNETQPLLAKKIAENSFNGRVFFCNSGAEANEGLIKLARRWGSESGRNEIICIANAFHGRTMTTLAATGKEKYMEGFAPYMTGFKHIPMNNIDALKAALTDQTVAVLIEPVQGEGGIHPAEKEFMVYIRQFCDKHNLLMLVDEIQCGVGRTGKMFAYQHYGVNPDGMSLAKALGNGFPIGAFTVSQKLKDVLTPGTHGTTFGGNPMACAASLAVFDTIEKEDLLEHCQEMETRLKAGLEKLKEKYSVIKDIRGLGLMVGIELTEPITKYVKASRQKNMLILSAGTHVLRLLPPINVSAEEIDEALAILEQIFEENQDS